MENVKERVLAWLDAHGIPYTRFDHESAATMEECAEISRRTGAYICKNYFLTTRSGATPCVCVVRPEARLRTSDISKQAGTSRLCFGTDELLSSLLHTRSGSVSPLGLAFEEARDVRLLIDSALLEKDVLAFHPCENTCTVVFTREVFFSELIPALCGTYTPVEIHDFYTEE